MTMTNIIGKGTINNGAVTKVLAAGQDDLLAELTRLRSENAALKAAKPQAKITFKVSEKGAVSVYGMGKWPVTLYRGQWERLIAAVPVLQAFIEENASRLTVKP